MDDSRKRSFRHVRSLFLSTLYGGNNIQSYLRFVVLNCQLADVLFQGRQSSCGAVNSELALFDSVEFEPEAGSFCCISNRSEYPRDDHRNAHRFSLSQDAQVLSLSHDA
jgi:hypothetical protein